MEARIRIGPRRSFALSHTLLIYRDNSAAFVTLHEVQREKDQPPYLGPGQPLSTTFLRTLARGLGSRITPESCRTTCLSGRPILSFGGARQAGA